MYNPAYVNNQAYIHNSPHLGQEETFQRKVRQGELLVMRLSGRSSALSSK